jgi:hypothetical protein
VLGVATNVRLDAQGAGSVRMSGWTRRARGRYECPVGRAGRGVATNVRLDAQGAGSVRKGSHHNDLSRLSAKDS